MRKLNQNQKAALQSELRTDHKLVVLRDGLIRILRQLNEKEATEAWEEKYAKLMATVMKHDPPTAQYGGRDIDLSLGAARVLGIVKEGVARVKIEEVR